MSAEEATAKEEVDAATDEVDLNDGPSDQKQPETVSVKKASSKKNKKKKQSKQAAGAGTSQATAVAGEDDESEDSGEAKPSNSATAGDADAEGDVDDGQEHEEDHADGENSEGAGTQRSSRFGSWSNRALSGLRSIGRELADSPRRVRVLKQRFAEQFGKTSKTVDMSLQKKVERLQQTQKDLQRMAQTVKNLGSSISSMSAAELSLSQLCEEMSQAPGSEAFAGPLAAHQMAHDVMSKNAVSLVDSIKFFHGQIVRMLRDHVQPLLAEHKAVEAARVEYDANRIEYEHIKEHKPEKLENIEARFISSFNRFEDMSKKLTERLDQFFAMLDTEFHKELSTFLNAYSLSAKANQSGLEQSLEKVDQPPPVAKQSAEADDDTETSAE